MDAKNISALIEPEGEYNQDFYSLNNIFDSYLSTKEAEKAELLTALKKENEEEHHPIHSPHFIKSMHF